MTAATTTERDRVNSVPRPDPGPTHLPTGNSIRIGFWRERLLATSETFIRTQSDSLTTNGLDIRTFGSAPVPSSLSRDTDLFPHEHYNVARFMNRVFFTRTRRSRRLKNLIRAHHVDLIHAHFATDAALITPIAKKLKIPLVVSVYGADVTRVDTASRAGRRRTRWIQEAFAYASAILPNSEYMRERAIALGAAPAKTSLMHLGIDVPASATRRAPVDGVLFVGRFTDKKGTDDLIRAISLLPDSMRSVRVTMIGDGDLLPEMKALAAALGVSIRFLGAQSHDVVKEELDRAAVLVAPSRTGADGDSEGLPTIILEAAARGLPVISTWHSGIPEAVHDGETGLLVDERSPEALSGALERILSDRDLAEDLGKRGHELMAREFSVHACAERLQQVYAQVVSSTS